MQQQEPEKLDFPAYGLLLLEAAGRMAPIDSGAVTSPAGIGSNVLNAGDKNWPVGKLAYLWVQITEGAGQGQARVIQWNAVNTLVIEGAWDVALNETSRFKIVSPFDLRQALRDVLGGGDDISATKPLPVTTEIGVVEKGVIHNAAYTTPDDFFATALTPTNAPAVFTLAGSFSVAGVLSVTITRGGDTQTVEFNAGVALAINSLYQFDVLVLDGDTINFQYSVNCNIQVFRVLER